MTETPKTHSADGLVGKLQVFVLRLPGERLTLFDQFSKGEEEFEMVRFCEPVGAFDHSRSQPLVTLICDDKGNVIRLAVGHRGYSAGTGLSQIALSDGIATGPISLHPVVVRASARVRSRIQVVVKSGGLLPPAASRAVLLGLVQHEVVQKIITAARKKQRNSTGELSDQELFRIQQEKDAAFTAMLIAGIDRETLLPQNAPAFQPGEWFLDRVPASRVREDPMVINDAHAFPGFTAVKQHISGAKRFRGVGVDLTIVMVNRQSLEELTGTDLIYYNETFKSFVMVQYKALEPEGDVSVFRLPDDGLAKEIGRMEQLENDLKVPDEADSSPVAFRLHSSPFFLKFCPRVVEEIGEPDLVPGMYFPLAHWQLLDGSGTLVGPKGAKVLRFQKKPPFTNADRYLNNTQFATLVRHAWVGTTIENSQVLEKTIELSLASGRSVTFATARERLASDAAPSTKSGNQESSLPSAEAVHFDFDRADSDDAVSS